MNEISFLFQYIQSLRGCSLFVQYGDIIRNKKGKKKKYGGDGRNVMGYACSIDKCAAFVG